MQINESKNKIPQDNHSKKLHNYLPYEAPKLRKHGKVNNVTHVIFTNTLDFDAFGVLYIDFS